MPANRFTGSRHEGQPYISSIYLMLRSRRRRRLEAWAMGLDRRILDLFAGAQLPPHFALPYGARIDYDFGRP